MAPPGNYTLRRAFDLYLDAIGHPELVADRLGEGTAEHLSVWRAKKVEFALFFKEGKLIARVYPKNTLAEILPAEWEGVYSENSDFAFSDPFEPDPFGANEIFTLQGYPLFEYNQLPAYVKREAFEKWRTDHFSVAVACSEVALMEAAPTVIVPAEIAPLKVAFHEPHRPPKQRKVALEYLKSLSPTELLQKNISLVEGLFAATGKRVSPDTMRRARHKFNA